MRAFKNRHCLVRATRKVSERQQLMLSLLKMYVSRASVFNGAKDHREDGLDGMDVLPNDKSKGFCSSTTCEKSDMTGQ